MQQQTQRRLNLVRADATEAGSWIFPPGFIKSPLVTPPTKGYVVIERVVEGSALRSSP